METEEMYELLEHALQGRLEALRSHEFRVTDGDFNFIKYAFQTLRSRKAREEDGRVINEQKE